MIEVYLQRCLLQHWTCTLNEKWGNIVCLDIFEISKNVYKQVLEDGGHQMHKYPEHFLFDSPLSDTRFNKNNF